MHKFHHTCKTKASVKEVAALILDIEKYPEFLPWCAGARILERHDDMLIADIIIHFKGITESYSSQVKYTINDDLAEIEVNLIKGPFKHLHNHWCIKKHDDGAIIDFKLEFELKFRLLAKILSPLFGKACDQMLEAFEKRMRDLYNNPQGDS